MTEMSRRRVLSSAGVAGVLAATGFVATRPTEVEAATTDPLRSFRSGQIKDLRIGGRAVRIAESSSDLIVTVDGRQLNHVQIHRDSPTRYLSHVFPHHEFADVKSLVAALVEGDRTLLIL